MSELERRYFEWLALEEKNGEVTQDVVDRALADYEFALAESKRLAA